MGTTRDWRIYMYKLIAIDIDGTLINDYHQVPEDVKSTITEAKKLGIKIVLCSGRPIGGMRSYIEVLDLNEAEDYAIAYNGAFVQATKNGDIISELSLGHNDLVKLYGLSLELNTPMHFFDIESLYTPNSNISEYTVVETYLNKIPLYYREIKDIPQDLSIPKIMYIDKPIKLTETIRSLPKDIQETYTVVQSAPYFLEFVHPSASKGNAVKNLANKLGIKQEEVMCIGDNGNDLSMITYAGCGVAMGNAIPEVKAVADFQTRTNNKSGVAYAIEKIALEPIRALSKQD